MSHSPLIKLIAHTNEVFYVSRSHVRMVLPVPGDDTKSVIIFDENHRVTVKGSVAEVISWLVRETFV